MSLLRALLPIVAVVSLGSLAWVASGGVPSMGRDSTAEDVGRPIQGADRGAREVDDERDEAVELTRVPGDSGESPPDETDLAPIELDVTPAPRGTFVVAGRVLDQDDVPVPGARIDFVLRNSRHVRWTAGSTRAGAGGVYRHTLDLEGAADIVMSNKMLLASVTGQGIWAEPDESSFSGMEGNVLEVDLYVDRVGADSIRGRVVDPEGVPVSGAGVEIVRWGFASNGLETFGTLTSSDGTFHAPSEGLRSDTKISAQAHLEGVGFAFVHGTSDLGTITLDPGLVLEGQLVSVTGKPLGEHEVFLWREGLESSEHELEADANGRFRAVALEAGEWRIEPEGFEELGQAVQAGATGLVFTLPVLTGELVVLDTAGSRLDSSDVFLFSVDPKTGARVRKPRSRRIHSIPRPSGRLDLSMDGPGHYGASYREVRDGIVWTGFLAFEAASSHLDLVLKVEPEATRAIELVPVDVEGAPIDGWRGTVRRSSDRWDVGDVSGTSSTIALADGAHEIHVITDGSGYTPSWRARFDVADGTERVELKAPASGGRVEFETRLTAAAVRKVSPGAARDGDAQLQVQFRRKEDRGWWTRLVGLAGFADARRAVALRPGEYVFKTVGWGMMSPSWKKITGTFTVSMGETTRVELLVDTQ